MGSQQQIGNWAFLFQLERLEAWSLMQKTRGAWVKNRTRIMYCHPEETVASVGNFSIPAWKWYAGLIKRSLSITVQPRSPTSVSNSLLNTLILTHIPYGSAWKSRCALPCPPPISAFCVSSFSSDSRYSGPQSGDGLLIDMMTKRNTSRTNKKKIKVYIPKNIRPSEAPNIPLWFSAVDVLRILHLIPRDGHQHAFRLLALERGRTSLLAT